MTVWPHKYTRLLSRKIVALVTIGLDTRIRQASTHDAVTLGDGHPGKVITRPAKDQ